MDSEINFANQEKFQKMTVNNKENVKLSDFLANFLKQLNDSETMICYEDIKDCRTLFFNITVYSNNVYKLNILEK